MCTRKQAQSPCTGKPHKAARHRASLRMIHRIPCEVVCPLERKVTTNVEAHPLTLQASSESKTSMGIPSSPPTLQHTSVDSTQARPAGPEMPTVKQTWMPLHVTCCCLEHTPAGSSVLAVSAALQLPGQASHQGGTCAVCPLASRFRAAMHSMQTHLSPPTRPQTLRHDPHLQPQGACCQPATGRDAGLRLLAAAGQHPFVPSCAHLHALPGSSQTARGPLPCRAG